MCAELNDPTKYNTYLFIILSRKNIKNLIKFQAEEITQQLRALTALLEDLSLSPTAHVEA